jgi:hypothetical protein
MSYIGNQPTTAAFVTDQFSANGSGTVFTLSTAPANTSSILVAVSGVLQDPTTYSVAATTLTFSAAPPAGTGNISVRFLGIPASGVTTTAYRTVTEFTATAGQTTFTPPSYTAGYISVYRNGVMLGSADYTASNGTTVVLATGATAGDLITTESFYVSSVLNAIPNTAQSVGWTNLPAGSVLQLVSFTTASQTTTTTSTYVDTALSLSITPKFATSKILVTAYCGQCKKTATDLQMNIQIVRASTSIFTAAALNNDGAVLNATNPTLVYLDSPATTSATTYKVQIADRDNVGTVTFNNNGTATITLMEIAA